MDLDQTGHRSFAAVGPGDCRRQALLVDDVAYNLKLLAEMLLALGFESTFATSIAEAKKALQYLSFDVAFLDCELPDGFGYELAVEIPSMSLVRFPTMIGMTASDDGGMVLRCFSAGMAAFLCKPLSFDQVCASLRKCELLAAGAYFEPPVRSKLNFKNIHFMAKGDHRRYKSYLEQVEAELAVEATALIGACRQSDPEAVRAIIHRLLSLTPLLESKEFTSVLQSCQRVARWHDLSLLQKLASAVELEYCLVRTSLQAELDRCQPAEIPWLRRSA